MSGHIARQCAVRPGPEAGLQGRGDRLTHGLLHPRADRRPEAARHLRQTRRTRSAAPPDSGNTSGHTTW
ncbi:hypothetical protein GCM10010106_45540 [Thermopolyspora flexuosa]|nr:hypothetical protein GCM10010106_45540 [Thermopolyspora flexuosa]